MAKLTTQGRKQIASKNFALPGGRYPIEDKSHARNALSRVSQFGSPSEKSEVRSKVHSKYPGIGKFAGGGWCMAAKKYAGGGMPGDDDADSEPHVAPLGGEPTGAPPNPAESVDMSNPNTVEALKGQLQSYLQKQSGGTNALQELADKYKDQLAQQGNRENYSPLLALADHYYGTQLAKNYTPPPTEAEQTAAVAKLQDVVNKERQPATADLLKEFGTATNAETKGKAILAKAQADQIKLANADTKADVDSMKELNKDKEYMAANTKVFKGPGLMSTIDDATYKGPQDPGNQVARQSLATEIGLYTSGGQRLHTATVDAMGLNRGALMTRLEQITSDSLHGTLTPENAKFAKDFIANEMKNSQDEVNTIKGTRAKEFESIHGRMPKWAPVAAAPQAPAPSGASGAVPAGMKMQINKRTGEKRFVPK